MYYHNLTPQRCVTNPAAQLSVPLSKIRFIEYSNRAMILGDEDIRRDILLDR